MNDQRRELITKGSLTKAIYSLSLPIIINNLIQTMYNLTDTFYVSKLGETALAAMQITYPMVFFMLSLAMGLSIGGIALISQYIGAQDEKKARVVSGQILTASLIASVAMGVLGYIFSGKILALMGATGQLHQLATQFLSTLFLGAPTVFIVFAFNGIKQGQGDTMTPMIVSALAVVTNIILDPIFIFTLGYGIKGAAYATILSRSIFNIVAIAMLFSKRFNRLKIELSDLKLQKKYIAKIVEVGLPAAVSQATTSIGFTVMNGFVLAFGEAIVNAFAIGNRISSIIFMPGMGIGGALSTIVGQNIGAGNVDRADQAFKTSTWHASLLVSVASVIMFPFTAGLVSIFTDDAYIISEGSYYLRMILLTIPLFGIFNCLIGLFQGSGHTMSALFLNLGRLWVLRIPMLMAIRALGIDNPKFIWYAMIISNIIIVAVGYLLYRSGKWRTPVIKKNRRPVMENGS